MNCREFRKFVGAFADGELDVTENLRALEHLNMCPVCTARVTQVNRMREALVRIYGRTDVPADLADKVRLALDRAEGAPDAVIPMPGMVRWIRRLAWPAAVAACLTLVWWGWSASAPSVSPKPGAITVVPGQVVSDVRIQHHRCAFGEGGPHHAPDLPRSPAGIAEVLSREMGLKVLSPDFSKQGFELIGADRCGILGRPGAHVMYRQGKSGPWLSLFTVARLPYFNRPASSSGSGSTQPAYATFRQDGVTVLAWNEGRQTYFACSKLPAEQVKSLVNAVRTSR